MQDYKFRFITMLAIIMVICACERENFIPTIKDDKEITTIAGTWKVVSYDDFAHNTQITKDADNTWLQINNGDVIMTFMDTLGTKEIEGVTVTNYVSGSYTITAPRKIKVLNFNGTYIDQPEWADLFWEKIEESDEFSVSNTHLRIFYNAKRNSITFEKI